MKKFLLILSVALSFIVTAPVLTARAGTMGGHGPDSDSYSDSGGRMSAPELDPGFAGGAMVLVLGGIAYLASRRRQDDED